MALCPEDVHALSLEEASDWLDERGISFELLETHEEVLDLIKATITNADNNDGKQNIQEFMSDVIKDDCAMKHNLNGIYTDLKTFARDSFGDELRQHINTIYTDIDARLEKNIDDLIHSENAIVVAGETGAGKSSFLNLLIGTDVLPCSLLSNTSAICQIHRSSYKRFIVLLENGRRETFDILGEGPAAEKDLIDKLSEFVGKTNYETSHKIKHVDIYWPVNFLKENVTIVDTPGVGESEEMTQKLVNYLPKAVAFIYIVNSANAGGIQEDTILRIISEQRNLVKEQELSSFDPKNMLFVCNKWDVVLKRGESERTWRDTVRKIKMTIPGLSEDHIFKMSVTEAVKYNKSNMGNTEMHQHLLEGLSHFVQSSLVANIKRHYRWITTLLSKIEEYIVSRINNAKSSAEEKSKLNHRVIEHLTKLNKDSKEVQLKVIEKARAECHILTKELIKHLQKDDVISFIVTWTDAESPDIIDNDLEVTRFEAKNMIQKRLLHVIQTWESETQAVEKTTQKLTDLFSRECLDVTEKCKEVTEILRGGSLPDGVRLVPGGGGSQPTDSDDLEAIHIAIILATAPIWIPIGIAAIAVFGPIGLGCHVVNSIRGVFERKEYRKNKAAFMKKWAHMLLEDLHKTENMSNLIEYIYLDSMIERINYLFSTFLPKQIEADMVQLQKILNDKRTADQIVSQFQPKKLKMKDIVKSLLLFDLKYLAEDVIDISKILRFRQIGGGSFSDVYRGTWKQSDGNEKEIALKILKGLDMDLQLSEVECSRKLRHNNIVEFYGVVFAERERCKGHLDQPGIDTGLPLYDNRLMLVQELCEQSLESLVYGSKEKRCGEFPMVSRLKETHQFFFEMCSSICNGLCYMHSMGYIHRDLKLSNVLVKNGVGKLSDLGFARAEAVMTGTTVGTLSHMAPELLDQKLYSFSSDVYSLGILIWELWYGTQSYSDAAFSCLGFAQFIDAVKRGARPSCDKEHKMMVELRDLVQRCWSNDPSRRPTVQQAATDLWKIDKRYQR